MLIRSIRGRLQAWYGGLLLAVLAGFGWTAFELDQDRMLRQLDEELRRRLAALGLPQRSPHPVPHVSEAARSFPSPSTNSLTLPRSSATQLPEPGERANDPVRIPAEALRLFDAGDSNGFYYVVWSLDRKELARSGHAPRDLAAPVRSHLPASSPPRTRGVYREIVGASSRSIILVGRSMASDLEAMSNVRWRLAGAGGAIWLIALGVGWWLATRAMAPLQLMSETAVKISRGDLSQRIVLKESENELGRLAGVLNATFARLEAAFAQQGRFTSDAAHELRTPLTVLLTQIQAALARPREGEAYRATMEACLRNVQRMRRLVESLLELARFDAGQELIKPQPVRLPQLIEGCVELLRPLAQQRAVQIEQEIPDLTIEGDENRLQQVITNLIGNAIDYNREGGRVRIEAFPKDGFVVVSVQDTGLGITPEHLPHLFDRFYRVEASRSGGRDHAGLGLAISKAIVEAHGGCLEVSSQPGLGSTFTLRLPCPSSLVSPCEPPAARQPCL